MLKLFKFLPAGKEYGNAALRKRPMTKNHLYSHSKILILHLSARDLE
jgi:hypothetical protein